MFFDRQRNHRPRPRLDRVTALSIVVAFLLTQEALAEAVNSASRRLDSPAGGWSLRAASDGTFERLDMNFAGEMVNIPWRPQEDKYRGPAWTGIDLAVYHGDAEAPVVTMTDEEGKVWPLAGPGKGDASLHYSFPAPDAPGQYTIHAIKGGKHSEAVLCVRMLWGWYLQRARAEALRMQQKPMMHREGWLGFFSAYWAECYAPDRARLAETEEKFQAFFDVMVDPAHGQFFKNKPTWPDRPQNSSWTLGLLTLRAAVARDVEHLQRSADWADDFIKRFQKPDGAFTHGKNSYGALTLGTKFLLDLVRLEQEHNEREAESDGRFADLILRHLRAIDRALANLEKVKDLGHTEGEQTYEDSQAGSSWSLLALHGQGWSCDTDVHEHFRWLAEQFVPNAFVLERADGTLRTWNCRVARSGERLEIVPSEPVVSKVHPNLRKGHPVAIRFAKETVDERVSPGMHWVGLGRGFVK